VNTPKLKIENFSMVKSQNYGLSLYYGKTFNSGLRVNSTVSYSGLESSALFNNVEQSDTIAPSRIKGVSKNRIREFNVATRFCWPYHPNHLLKFGIEFAYGKTKLKNHIEPDLSEVNSEMRHTSVYAQDQMILFNRINLRGGLRASYYHLSNQFRVEPRLSFSIELNNYWKLTGRTGWYHQNILNLPIDYVIGSFNTFFQYSGNNAKAPYLSNQSTGGMVFLKNGFEVSAELFIKNDKNLVSQSSGYTFDAQQKGIDIFIKKEHEQFTAWMSYTYLKKNTSNFSDIDLWNFYLSEFEQHEIKLAGIYNLKRFTFSANYIKDIDPIKHGMITPNINFNNYSRFDLSAVLHFKKGRLKGEAGISILNIFNNQTSGSGQLFESISENEIINKLNYKIRSLPRSIGVYQKITF
jgi:outer membrane receptor for ferrienterochelin and colicin